MRNLNLIGIIADADIYILVATLFTLIAQPQLRHPMITCYPAHKKNMFYILLYEMFLVCIGRLLVVYEPTH